MTIENTCMRVRTMIDSGWRTIWTAVSVLILSAVAPAWGATGEEPVPLEAPALADMSLEALMNLQVTSVSKKTQKLANAAAAVFVITQDDIRRSGATSIPEALRMAPGVQVARIDANKWAVSIRGFNGRFANKLLVLMDGRSLYTPLFSGVFWEVQDTALEDIDRIEVIRGPGAALWGANAVNGVINIITRTAGQTPGGLVSAGGGTEERAFATARYGTSFGEATDLRVYAKYLNRDNFVRYDSPGDPAHDAWNMSRLGFRLDSQVTDTDTLTLQGDYYDGTFHEAYENLFPPPTFSPTGPLVTTSDASGGYLLSRWERKLSDTSGLSLQFYYDHTTRDMVIMSERRDMLDMDFQHRFSLGSNNDIIWGLGYRFNHDKTDNGKIVTFNPSTKNDSLYSAFLHDEITLSPKYLSLILGSRFEHNDYSGFEIEPNVRLLFTPSPRHTLWTAVSRSVRTPSQADQDIQYFQFASFGLPPDPTRKTVVTVAGSGSFMSETVIAYDLGYRTEPLEHLTFDLATFYNYYSHLRTVRTGSPLTALSPEVFLPLYTSNEMHGHSYGVEVAAEWQPLEWWHLQASYSYLTITSYLDGVDIPFNYNTVEKNNLEGSYPHNQFSLRSGFDLGGQVELDLWLRGADRLRYIDKISIPGYITLDARLAWKPVKSLEIALVGQNLLHNHRPEFRPELINTAQTEMPRGVYGKVTWRF